MTVFVVSNGLTNSRFGVAATRKLGSAVERNLAKRRSRELFRRHKIAAGLDIIIVPRRDLLDAPFTSLEADYITALRRSRTPASGTGTTRHSGRRPRDASRV
jgi:ribonuclease P protein component